MSLITAPAAPAALDPSAPERHTGPERRSPDSDSNPEVLLIVDVVETGTIANVDLAARSRSIKKLYAELAKVTRSGDVIRPMSSSRIHVMLRSVPVSSVEQVAARLERALQLIELDSTTTLHARVTVATS